MAYDPDTMLQINVRGVVGTFEAWSNTWTVLYTGAPAAADEAQLAADFNNFYGDATDVLPHLSNDWSATGATITRLGVPGANEASWTTATGAATGNNLPTQLAMRISLSRGVVRGGPFISGFTVAALEATGLLTSALVTDFATSLDTLIGTLEGHDFSLAIDRPTVETVAVVTQARIGHRLDVIRKRGNDTPETYEVVTP